MGYLIVFVVSLVIGVAVFFTSLRRLSPTGPTGFGEPASAAGSSGAPPEAAPGTSYVPVALSRHDWQARLTGILGLAISVAVAGIALAISIYAVGALIAKLFGGIGGSEPPAA